jgi:hypothetical protein
MLVGKRHLSGRNACREGAKGALITAAVKWILRIALGLAAVIGTVALVGYFLPVAHEAWRSAEFNEPPETVYALISDLKNYSSWWPENEVAVEAVEASPPSRFVTRIVGESAFGGTWTWAIEQTPNGARATVTERGEIYNPIFRTLARFVFGYTGSMESCLTAAQRRLST